MPSHSRNDMTGKTGKTDKIDKNVKSPPGDRRNLPAPTSAAVVASEARRREQPPWR